MAEMAPKLAELVKRIATRHTALPVMKVVSVLVGAYHGLGTWYSPSQVAEALPSVKVTEVLEVLQLLSGDPYQVLAVKWLLFGTGVTFDPVQDEDQETFEVPAHVAFMALSEGWLPHPLTGEAIQAKGRVHVHYEPLFPFVEGR